MVTFILVFVVISLVMLGMSVGVLAGRSPIKGSCGGLNQFGEEGACEICGGNPKKCDSKEDNSQEKPILEKAMKNFYDAAQLGKDAR